MATLLRSSKYIRCLNGFAQRIIVSHANTNFVTKSLALQVQRANAYLTKSYATIPVLQRKEGSAYDDGGFAKLDDSVRRLGRVFKSDVESTLANVRSTGYISSLDALLLIRCCGDFMADASLEERIKLTHDIWNTFDALSVQLDVSHFNVLLKVYLENNCEFSPIDFLTTMKDKHIHPNRITYERLMLFYCKKGDIEGATKILEVLKEKDIPLSAGVFDALIIGHSEANDMTSAEQVIKVMKDAGVQPGSNTYTALLCARAKRGDVESIKNILNELETTNIFLQHTSFFEIVQTFATNGHEHHVDSILSIIPQGPNYNVDAVIAILKLLDTGHLDIGLKILSTLKKRRGMDEHILENESGSFLIKKMVNAKYPLEKIVETCKKLEEEGTNVRAFAIATGRCLENGDVERSLALLKAWMENGGELREHYFWPLLVANARAANYQGILDIIKQMVSLEITPTVETIKEFVVPYAVGTWNDVITSLEEINVSRSVTVSGIACKMLSEHKIHNTLRFLSSNEVAYEIEHFYAPLTEAVKNTNDALSFVAILRLLQNSLPEMSQNIVDTAMRTLIDDLSNTAQGRSKHMLMEKVLKFMEEFGLNISTEVGVEIRQYFQNYTSPTLDERIEKLTSSVLTPIPMSELVSKAIPDSMNSTDSNEGLSRQSVLEFAHKRRLTTEAMKEKNIADVDRLSEEIESLNIPLSGAFLAQLVEFYCSMQNIEKAEKWVNKCKVHDGRPMLDLHKSMMWTELLIKNDRFDDAIQFIKNASKMEKTYESNRHRWLVRSLLNTAANTGNVEKTNELFEALVKNNWFTIEKYFLSPLVKVRLVRGDVQGAIDVFDNACKEYKCTPCKGELFKKLIEIEDAPSLQRLTDLNSEVHGESNSLLDLVLSFIECGRLRQARKILETPELRLKGRKLILATERYIEQGNVELLEQFIEISKGLPVINRSLFYEILLEAYCKNNYWQRGLVLWTNMQDENLQPTEKFLATLGHLLKINKQAVPFEFESYSPTENSTRTRTLGGSTETSATFKEISAALKEGDLDSANNLMQRWKAPNQREFRFALGSLIETTVNRGKLEEGTKLLEDMIMLYNVTPTAFTYKTIWNALIRENQYERLVEHGKLLNKETKQSYRFNKYVARAYLNKVGLPTFLAEFEAKLTESKNENMIVCTDGLHFSAIITELKKDPSMINKLHELAEKLALQNIYSPINMVWCYYFENNDPKSDEIWDKWFATSYNVLVNHTIDTAMKANNVELMNRLYQKIQTNNRLTPSIRINTLAPLIELYCRNGQSAEALKIARESAPEIVELWRTKFPTYFANFEKYLEAEGKSFVSKRFNRNEHNKIDSLA